MPRLSTPSLRAAARNIHLYGWDSRTELWHGPNDVADGSVPDRRLLRALRSTPGKSWHGAVSCAAPGEPATPFFVLVHDLADCGIASIYCDQSKAGPAEVLAVIPECRRPHLRNEFAFEFLAFAGFLGALGAGAELEVHDAIVSALAEPQNAGALVFSVSTGLWPSDHDLALSCCAEKVAVTLCRWLDEHSAPAKEPRRPSTSAA